MSDAVFDKLIDECMSTVRDAFSAAFRGLARELKAVPRNEPEEQDDDDDDDDHEDVEFHASFWQQSSSSADEVQLHDDEEDEVPTRKRVRDDELEDIDDDDDDDAEREETHQMPAFRMWRLALTESGKGLLDWEDLTALNNAWFAQRYVVPLDMVRSGLGAQTRNQSYVRARWDYALSETLLGRALSVDKSAGNGRTTNCDLCGALKRCTYECGTWRLGSHCAKLLRAWLKWCKALREALSCRAAALTRAHLKRLDCALTKVCKAHANKGGAR